MMYTSMRLRFNLILLLFLLHTWPSMATDYYFSTVDGNDARTSQEAQNPMTPWRTIDKLNQLVPSLKAGDRVFFKRGEIYSGGIVLNKAGADNSPIVLSAYGEGMKPVISGLHTVSGWQSRGGGIYESGVLPASSVVNMVLIDGRNYAMGRYPNADAENGGYLTVQSHGPAFIQDASLGNSPNWKGAEAVMRNARWILDRAPITSHSNGRLNYNPSGIYYMPVNGYGYFIQNHINTLDRFGEWYYNPATRRLSVHFGNEAPDDIVVQVAVVDVLVDIRANNIVLENLALSGANRYAIFNNKEGLRNLAVRDCDISFSGVDAILNLSSINFQVERCTIVNSNNNAIYLREGCQDCKVRNNYIANTGMQAGMGESGDGNYVAIYNRAPGFIAERNVIVNTGYIGIHFSGNGSLIKNNYIHTFCTVKDDGGGIYSFVGSENASNAEQTVAGNIVMNGVGAPYGTDDPDYLAAEGIYLDDNVNNIEVLDNTVAYCGHNGIFVHNARGFTISRNTCFSNQVQFSIVRDAFEAIIDEGVVTENIFFSKELSEVVASFRSIDDDLGGFATLSNNYYTRPVDENLIIFTQTNSESASNVQEFDLSEWKNAYGLDQGSAKSPVGIPKFELNSMDGVNKYGNGRFDENVDDINCFSPTDGDCVATWVNEDVMDGGSLRIDNASESRVQLEIGGLEPSEQYLLKFSAAANLSAAVEVLLRLNGTPWTVLSQEERIQIGPDRKEYEILFSFPKVAQNAILEFYTTLPNLTYLLDNVGLFKADATPVDPGDYLRFEYNPTMMEKVVDLDANYVDVRNNMYSGSIILDPFESIILIRDDNAITSVLPATLSHFSSEAIGCEHIAVHWTSEQESDLSHYELEKSTDGGTFQTIFTIEAANGADARNYSVLDSKVSSRNYYRLKMVNLDSSLEYSRIIFQSTGCQEESRWTVYPNPMSASSQALRIRFNADGYEQRTFLLADQLGRTVRQLTVDVAAGRNFFTWELGGLSPGMYYVYDAGAGMGAAQRLVVGR